MKLEKLTLSVHVGFFIFKNRVFDTQELKGVNSERSASIYAFLKCHPLILNSEKCKAYFIIRI